MPLSYKWSVSLLVSLWMVGCSVEVGNPKNPLGGSSGGGSGPTATSFIASDSAAAVQIIGDNLDEVIASLSGDNASNSEASLALASNDAKPAKLVGTTRSCVRSGQTTAVTLQRSGTLTRQRRKPALRIKAEIEQERVATWSRPDGEPVYCNLRKTYAFVNLRKLDAINLSVRFSKSLSQSITRTGSGEQLPSKYVSAKGIRELSWQKSKDLDSGERVHNLTIAKSIERVSRFTTETSGQRSVHATVATKDDDKLDIETRIASDQTTTQTIKGGTVVSTIDDGARIESTYKDVVFSGSASCQPDSGSISGKLFDASHAETPLRSYEVVFSDDGAVITFDNGERQTYQISGCDFEGT